MISSLEQLHIVFTNMTENGWDISLPMKWGFFFCDENKDNLQSVFTELQGSGYQLESIYQVDEKDDIWTLHASKVDILTPEKLHRRNLAFNELADYCQVAYYDGWDVERI